MFAALVPDDQAGQIIGGVTITLCNLFSGVVTIVSQLPHPGPGGGPGYGFLYYANPVAHAVRLGSLPQFDGCTNPFSTGDCATIFTLDATGAPQLTTAYNYAVLRLSMTFDRRWEAAGWVVFIGAVYALVATIAYRRVNWQKR